MPQRTVDPIYIPQNFTVPPGTTIAAPLTTVIVVERGVLESIDLQVPRGHCGATGIRFTLSSQQFLPWSNAVSWINGDDLKETFACDVEVDTQLRAVAYNIGQYPHTFYCRFKIRRLTESSVLPPLRLLSAAELAG